MFGNKMNAIEKAVKKGNANALVGLADNKDEAISLEAIKALGTVGGMDASNYLVNRLQSPDVKVRMAVAKSLGEIADVHTKAFLFAQMNKETDPAVKSAMSEAMVKIREY